MKSRCLILVLAAFASGNELGTTRADEPVKEKATLKGHTEVVVSLAFSPDGKSLASGSGDNSIKFWDLSTGKNTSTLTKVAEYWVVSLAFSPNGKTLAVGNGGNTVKLLDIDMGKWTNLIEEESQYASPMVVFSPDGKILASGGRCMKDIKLWDVATGKNKATLEGYDEYGITALSFTSDGKTLATMGCHDGLKLWDVATGKIKSELKIEDCACAAFSPDCKTLAAGTFEDLDEVNGRKVVKKPAYVKLWEVSSGKELAALKHSNTAWQLAFSPDGKLLVSEDWNDNFCLRVWNVSTRKEISTINGYRGKDDHRPYCTFSPDSKMILICGEDKTIKFWDVSLKK